jgi:hypothetical protein
VINVMAILFTFLLCDVAHTVMLTYIGFILSLLM